MKEQWIVEYCSTCHGRGVVYKDYSIIGRRESTCPDCQGRGRLSEKRIYTMDG